jgi:predicted AAA+ superfamily ATPase
MTHQRNRFIEAELTRKLAYSPCVGVLGMRQVGKSTLIRKLSANYETFDDQSFLIKFEADPQSYLEAARYPLGLDEVQKSPKAFDAIKYAADRLKKPGRYLLSGSVRFSARKQIRESLTGRIALMELLPFTLAECHGKPLSSFVARLEKKRVSGLAADLKKKAWAQKKDLLTYLEMGGLPGICFRREARIRSESYDMHIETLLARDITLIRHIRLGYGKLRLILEELNHRQGLPLNMSDLARKVSTSVPSIKSILEALDGLFLIKPHGSTYFIADNGLSSHLFGQSGKRERQDLLRLVFHELNAQINYTAKLLVRLNPYQTRGGIDVPFFLEYKSGKRVAIFVEETDRPSQKAMNSAAWLAKKFPDFEAVTLYQADEFRVTSKGMACIPLHWLY